MTLQSYNPDKVELPCAQLIDGAALQGDGEEYHVLRPSDGRLARTARGASPALVDRAVCSARAAWQTSNWAQVAPRDRARVLYRWADAVSADAENLARLESVTSPRLYSLARKADIFNATEIIRFAAEAADKLDGQVLQTEGTALSLVLREPYGVVAGIAPWNAPLGLALAKLAPALAAGNACVLKPSEFTPYSLVRLVQLSIESGVPPGMVAVVSGTGAETGRALVTHPGVSYVSFTGSTSAGARVMADAALSGCKPVSLELGGKSPHLVFDDVDDIDRLAELVGGWCMRNAGQVCFSGSRLVAHRSLAEPLMESIMHRMKGVRHGPTWDVDTQQGPIMSEVQAQRIEGLLQRSQAAGAECLQGGKRADVRFGGAYFEPTVLVVKRSDNPAVLEEFFGPVLTVQVFDDDDEGIALADHPVYGLAAGVHTRDLHRALRAARTIAAGTVWVNHYGIGRDYNVPFFAPHRQSGLGQEGGMGGVSKYLKSKAIRIQHG